MKVSSKILLTGITAFLSQLSSVLIALILPKLLIYAYGSDLNGIISAARQYSSYIAMIDSGIAAATCYQFIRAFKDNDKEKIKNLYKTVGVFFRKVAYIVIFITVVFSICYAFVLKSTTDFVLILYIFFMYSLGTIVAFWVFFKYNLVLFSDGDQYKITFACIASSLFVFICQYFFVKSSVSIYFVIAVYPIAIILRLLAIRFMTLKKHPYICKGGIVDNSLISQKWDSITLNIADNMKTFAPIISISFFYGASYVSIYAIYESILHFGSSILIMCQSGITPVLGKTFIEKTNLAKERFECLYTIVFIISAIIVTCFSCLFISFIKIYLGIKTDVSYVYPWLSLFMIINIWFLMARTTYDSLIKANGMIKELRNGAIIEICLALFSCVLLAWLWGYEYIILGVILSSAYRTVRMALFCKKRMDFGKKILQHLILWGGLATSIVYLFNNIIKDCSIPQFVAYSSLILLLSSVLYFIVGFALSRPLRKLCYHIIGGVKFFSQK